MTCMPAKGRHWMAPTAAGPQKLEFLNSYVEREVPAQGTDRQKRTDQAFER